MMAVELFVYLGPEMSITFNQTTPTQCNFDEADWDVRVKLSLIYGYFSFLQTWFYVIKKYVRFETRFSGLSFGPGDKTWCP